VAELNSLKTKQATQCGRVELAYNNLNNLYLLTCNVIFLLCRNATNHKDLLDQSLNMMARAVEANPSCSVLWQHYLAMYSKRSDAHKDLLLLYEQAIEHAPSYEIYWKVSTFFL